MLITYFRVISLLYRVLKIAGVHLLSSVLIAQGLEKRYLTGRPIDIEIPNRKY